MARQVVLDLSNFGNNYSQDSSKRLSNSAIQMDSVLGLRGWRNGWSGSATENAYAIWLSRPNHERIPKILRGVGKLKIGSKDF